MQSLQNLIAERVTAALTGLLGDDGKSADPIIRASQDARFGDYQSNCAMGLAKKLSRKPREVAEDVVARLQVDDLSDPPQIAGPGFINFRIRPQFLATQLETITSANDDDRMDIAPTSNRQVVVVDMSSPNLAKEMHVGHLRPTIIGDAVARILEFQGHEVHRLNHIGDWGTQFGMLIQYLRETQPDVLEDPDNLRIGDLEAFYISAKSRFDGEAAFADQSRQAVVDLQSGDATARTIWKAFCGESLRHCHDIYDLLDVSLIDRGESFYNDMLPGVVEELMNSGVATESEGAICVFPEGFKGKDDKPLPMIIRKSDGGFGYSTTDLAALKHRIQVIGAQRIVYVVGNTQKQHFDMLFTALKTTGWAEGGVEAIHLPFGVLLKEDGKPFKTREGGTVKLRELLEEAIAREKTFLETNENDPEKRRGYGADQIAHMAKTIGLASVKYFELSHNWATDYRFDWDLMLALEGNTAPYMLYAYARICSIAGKAGIDPTEFLAAPLNLEHECEIALARAILKLPEVLTQLERDLKPNMLTEYLFALSKTFSTFYDRNTGVSVINAESHAQKLSRLRLCDLTRRALKLGLGLLGIETLERM
jgi:arginyl-tRNA synthetase